MVLEVSEILHTTGTKEKEDGLRIAVDRNLVALLGFRDQVVDLHPLIQGLHHLVALVLTCKVIVQSLVLQKIVVHYALSLKVSQVNS